MNNDDVRIDLCDENENEMIHQKLREYNAKYFRDAEEYGFCCKDEKGNIIAGIVATREHQCMNIDYL